jgi:electron transfer flavoprotein-quinone oxidoreductase
VAGNPRFINHYPALVGAIMKDVYSVPAGAKERLYPTIRKHLTLSELWSLFMDLKGIMKI